MKKYLILLAVFCIVAGLMAVAPAPKRNVDNPPPANPYRTVFYTEDFESGATGWTHYDGAVSPNQWHIYNGDGYATAPCWWMGEEGGNGGYYDTQYLVLDTQDIAISTGNSTLSFAMKHGLEDPGASGDYDGWDSFNIRISINSGFSWSVIPTTALSVPYDFANSYAFGSEHGEGLGVPGWGGTRPWTTVTADLSSYLVGGAANVKIRFAFASDPAYSTADNPTLFGVMVDNITLASYSNLGVETGMSYSSLVPTAGDFWHIATDASAPSPTHIMSSVNSFGTYEPFMLNYLVSPEIILPADATQIVADFQMKGTYSDTGVFPDVDFFGWEIFYGGTWHYMSNPYNDPEGSNYVYSSAPDNWASMVLSYSLDGDITALAGQTVKFAWYFKSNSTVSGTPLQIDNFQIFSVSAAPAPPNLVYPVNGQIGLPNTGFDLDWTANSQGALPEYYTVYMDMDEANLELDTFNPSYTSADLTVSLYNPVTAGLVTFASSQRWYWRVGASIAGQDEALSDIYRFDIVNTATVISTFPWNEGFEGATFPPTNWTRTQLYLDADATNWAVNTTATYVHSGTKSAVHAYNDTTPEPGQNGWLISPPVQLPATGVPAFSFWNYNRYGYEVINDVLINTTNDPYDPFWVPIWSQDETAGHWSQETVNLTSYIGDMVYFAFKYAGFDANNWYVDDVNVTIYTTDTMAPTITHLPYLNTLRTDIPYTIVADVADDAVFNNPVTASLFYSTDGGTNWSAAIPMVVGTAPTYSADIPAQALGTTVTYKIQAWDSLNNTITTSNFSFGVNDPTWIQYDDDLPLSFTGFPTYVWGPMIYYENPLYGTGTALQLLAVDGAVHNNNTGNPATLANLHIYSEDLEGNLTDLITPMPVSFIHRTRLQTDLSALNIQITSPWFWISYEDMPLGCYFQYDATYNYTTLYLKTGGNISYSSSTGEWCIGAYVQSVAGTIDAPIISIANVAGSPTITWGAVAGANHYDVYGAANPYAPDPWTMLGSPTGTSFTYSGPADKQFFKVVSNSAPSTRGAVSVNKATASSFLMKPSILR